MWTCAWAWCDELRYAVMCGAGKGRGDVVVENGGGENWAKGGLAEWVAGSGKRAPQLRYSLAG